MAIAPLHIQIKSDLEQTAFDIHHFNPTVRESAPSQVGSKYDYVVLSQGAYNAPTQVRLFMDRDDVLALYAQLTPIVEKWRTQAQVSAVAADVSTPEVALV